MKSATAARIEAALQRPWPRVIRYHKRRQRKPKRKYKMTPRKFAPRLDAWKRTTPEELWKHGGPPPTAGSSWAYVERAALYEID